MNPEKIRAGMKVRLLGPAEHPLHGRTGVVVRVLEPELLWSRMPMMMMGDQFAWVTGQVLVSLDSRPRRGEYLWTPVVQVRPEEIEPAGAVVSAAASKAEEVGAA